jgi:hypothetical protein
VGQALGGEPAQGGRAGVLVRLGGDQDPVGGEQDLVTRANDGLGVTAAAYDLPVGESQQWVWIQQWSRYATSSSSVSE